MAAAAPQPPGFADYIAALSRRRLLFAGIALPIILAAMVLAVTLPDIYRSSALIEIDDGASRQRFGETANPRDEPGYADQYVSSLQGIVLTDENLRRLLTEHQLYPDQESDPTAVMERLRGGIDVQIVTAPVIDPRTGREREVVTAFTTSYGSRNPAAAQTVAGWLAQEFLAANRRQYGQSAQSAAEFYRTESERVGQQIADREAKLAQFKNENFGRLPELTEANLASIDRSERDLNELQQQARGLRQERVFLTSQLEQARAANPEGTNLRQLEAEYQRRAVIYDESHPDLISLRRQIEALRRGGGANLSLRGQLEQQRSILAEARQRYSEDHPDVRRVQQAINSLEARIAAGERADVAPESSNPAVMQLRTQITAIDAQLSSIEARSTEVRTKLSEVERNVVASPQVEREYQNLTRDLSIARTQYEELLKRQMDAQISEAAISAGRMDEFRIAQMPLLSTSPAEPNRLGIALVGLVLGLILGFSGTLAVEMLDPTVRGMRDIRDTLQVSALAAVPQIQNSVSRRQQFKKLVGATAVLVVCMSVVLYVLQSM